jgi:hypothetical protein
VFLLIVLPLPPGENPLAVNQINNNIMLAIPDSGTIVSSNYHAWCNNAPLVTTRGGHTVDLQSLHTILFALRVGAS